MKKILFLIVIILISSQVHAYNPDYKNVTSGNYTQDKNFYLLTLLNENEDLKNIISANVELNKILDSKLRKMKFFSEQIINSSDSVCNLYRFSEDENKRIKTQFAKIFQSNEKFKSLVKNHLRDSGYFILFEEQTDEDLFLSAWDQTIEGLNYIIDVYGKGEKGRYAKIDSVTYPVDSRVYQFSIHGLNGLMYEQNSMYNAFFEPTLRFVNELLEFNYRDEAGRFEPMHKGENQATFDYIKNINWDDYKYSVMLVPGYGHEESHLPLHPLGMMRCKIAADRYNKGLAPLIIVSGGYVHPFQTKHCEAIEMKKELMEKHNIPEKAIIIEPHARHTTTNFRNASRLIYRYGISTNKKALVTTTRDQSYYITDMNLDKRCEEELGYVPFKLHERISLNDVEWEPVIKSMHYDPNDPLDP